MGIDTWINFKKNNIDQGKIDKDKILDFLNQMEHSA